jgi:CelD/BcsL family acetyltransferase involved in cellulose biosynthesis
VNIHTSSFEHLTKDEINTWSKIQRAEPLLASPYFRSEFTEAVAAVRNDVEVAVLKDRGRPIGFLPFQRSRRNVGHPVGGILSDFQGLIAPPNTCSDPLELLRACKLSAWHFDHLLLEQRFFSSFVCREADSPFVDLSDGLDAYLARRKHGAHILSEYGQKSRKLAREIGPIRFEAHVADPAILSTLLAWKSDHIRRKQVPNIFDYAWVRNLITKICEFNSLDFSAVMSVIYAGDKVAAIDFGMRSRSVLHSWFPTYNTELANYSPGFLCWIETIMAAESLGIRRIDFGKGSEPFKYRLMSGVTKVAEGTADVRQGAAMVRRACWSARDFVRASPLAAPARMMSQNVRRVRHWFDAKIANQGS